MSHGYYSHSYAAMQSSARFCRKNGVCGISMNSPGKKPNQQTTTKHPINLFLRWKRNGKNSVTHTAELVPLLHHRGKTERNEGQPPAGFFASSLKAWVSSHFHRQQASKLQFPRDRMCTLLLDTAPLYEKSVGFFSVCRWSDFHSSFRHLFVKQEAVSERAEAWKFSVIAETAQVSLNYPMLPLD